MSLADNYVSDDNISFKLFNHIILKFNILWESRMATDKI